MTQENTHHGSILNPRTPKTNKQKDRNTKAPEKRGSASLYNLKKYTKMHNIMAEGLCIHQN